MSRLRQQVEKEQGDRAAGAVSASTLRPGLGLRPAPGHAQRSGGLVGRLSARVRLAVLLETMPLASDEENDALAGELVEMLTKGSTRMRAATARAAARLFAKMPAHARSAALCVAREALIDAAKVTEEGGGDDLARRSRAMLASATGAAVLCADLTTMLVDADPRVAGDAERALLEMARSAEQRDDGERAACHGAILDAVAGFDQHRKRGVLLEAVKLLGTVEGLAAAIEARSEWLADPSHPAQMGLRSIIRREEGTDMARAAMVWLRLASQAPACRDRLLSAGTSEEHGAALEMAHLLEHPERRRGLSGVKPGGKTPARTAAEPMAWTMDSEALERLPASARRQLPRFFDAIQLNRVQTEAYRTALALDEAAPVRLASIVSPGGGVDADARLDLAYDGDAGVARAAVVRLTAGRGGAVGRGVRGQGGAEVVEDAEATVARLRRSPHASVRAVCWAGALDEHGAAARTAWRQSLRRDRAGTLSAMRDRILMGTVRERMAWLTTWRTMGMAGAFERELCDLVEEFGVVPLVKEVSARRDELALAATAVAALGECAGEQGGRGARVLEHALVSADARIAANGVEALVRRQRRAGGTSERVMGVLVELKDSREHRVRANAALALVQGMMGAEGKELGAETLDHMLIDVSPTHRLAGVWLAERVVVGEGLPARRVAGLVQDLQTDDDPRVQVRAGRARRRLGVMAGAREVVA